jgi:hypothetical protein
MNIDEDGSFRTRTTGDGSLEVWARGWRLESQLYALIPMGLALMFLAAPMSPVMRAVGAIVMVAAALLVFRMTKLGLLFRRDAVTVIGVVRSRRFLWESVAGFMGERRHDEGRVNLVLSDGAQVGLPGTLDPGELDPYGDEGEALSAVDQLNRLGERARDGDLARRSVPSISAGPAEERGPSRADRRRERKELRAALKAVRLDDAAPEPLAEEPVPSRRLRRRPVEPAPELTPVAIAEPVHRPARRPEPADEEPSGLPSYFPKPVYIPQAEYAQMLRDQRAAEKAAAAAAEELSELAELDELAQKDEFSDWTR